ncbi:MAG: beta-N-acetylhexosaminidase [Pseudomonadota bacterium]
MRTAFITGLDGERLSDREARFLRAAEPAGLILFARNVATPEQVRRLIGDACEAIGHNDTLVLVDQEGGRVQRFRPPEWKRLPAARTFIEAADGDCDVAAEQVRLIAHAAAAELRPLGINVICAPVLDVPAKGADPIIGTRAYADDPDTVAELARAQAEGLMAGGAAPVGKHVPGHGRADADSHLALPTVDVDVSDLASRDFAPFKALADLPAMMTAHVLYLAIDETEPASTSRRVHDEIIRGAIGFDGLLMSDDLSMGALEGTIARRAERCLAAGSDVALYCKGVLSEMEAVASVAPALEGDARHRCEACFAASMNAQPLDAKAAAEALRALIAFEDKQAAT